MVLGHQNDFSTWARLFQSTLQHSVRVAIVSGGGKSKGSKDGRSKGDAGKGAFTHIRLTQEDLYIGLTHKKIHTHKAAPCLLLHCRRAPSFNESMIACCFFVLSIKFGLCCDA